MTPWKDALTEGLLSGTLAAVLSGVVVSDAGRRQGGSAVAPINAVSHWLWGDAAARDESINARHTGVGAATQMLAGIFWGTLHAKLRPRVRKADINPTTNTGGVATAAVAGVVDYGLIPKRLTPGFELRVSNGSVLLALAAIAAGIAAGTVAVTRLRS